MALDKRSGSEIAKEKQESQLRTSNIIGAANLYVNAKTLQSLNQLNRTQQELVSINQELVAINQNVLDELTRQTNILERQEVERKAEKYQLEVQNQLKDVVFNVNKDVEKLLNKSSSLAESYFSSRALVWALESYNISSLSFAEINDKVFWSNLEEKINNITIEVNNSNDSTLKEFVAALEELYEIERLRSGNDSTNSKSISDLNEELVGINNFLEIYKDHVSLRKKFKDCLDDEFHVYVKNKIVAFIWPNAPHYGWNNISEGFNSAQVFGGLGIIGFVIALTFLIDEWFVLSGILGIASGYFLTVAYNWLAVIDNFPDEWKIEFEARVKILESEINSLEKKLSEDEIGFMELNEELKEKTRKVAIFSKHYPFLNDFF